MHGALCTQPLARCPASPSRPRSPRAAPGRGADAHAPGGTGLQRAWRGAGQAAKHLLLPLTDPHFDARSRVPCRHCRLTVQRPWTARISPSASANCVPSRHAVQRAVRRASGWAVWARVQVAVALAADTPLALVKARVAAATGLPVREDVHVCTLAPRSGPPACAWALLCSGSITRLRANLLGHKHSPVTAPVGSPARAVDLPCLLGADVAVWHPGAARAACAGRHRLAGRHGQAVRRRTRGSGGWRRLAAAKPRAVTPTRTHTALTARRATHGWVRAQRLGYGAGPPARPAAAPPCPGSRLAAQAAGRVVLRHRLLAVLRYAASQHGALGQGQGPPVDASRRNQGGVAGGWPGLWLGERELRRGRGGAATRLASARMQARKSLHLLNRSPAPRHGLRWSSHSLHQPLRAPHAE